MVLDNAGIHTSKVVKRARQALAKLGIYLYYLPAYSTGLSRVGPAFERVEHHEMPARSFASGADPRRRSRAGSTSTTIGSPTDVTTSSG